MEEEAARRKRDKKYVTRAGVEERKERGLDSPKKRVRGAPRRNRNREAAEFFFFFAAGMKKEDGDCKTELAAGTIVELKQEPALITDPNFDVGKCI
ncbi:hypothetical protein TNCV_3151191 [Trichonephila clavipes]|nr:hypothetical protein TNCV_3151191 [Trichonephila clavipes]